MNFSDPITERLAPDTTDFDFLQLEELLRRLEELLDQLEPLDEAVVTLEDEMLLELPVLGLLVAFEVRRQFGLVLAEGVAKFQHDLHGDLDFVVAFLNLDLRLKIGVKSRFYGRLARLSIYDEPTLKDLSAQSTMG